jgi:sirohydrochlorin ferrochelatase
MSRDSVTVVPVLLAPGKLTKVGLPRDLANLPVRYTGEALLPHPALGRWIARRVRDAVTPAVIGAN